MTFRRPNVMLYYCIMFGGSGDLISFSILCRLLSVFFINWTTSLLSSFFPDSRIPFKIPFSSSCKSGLWQVYCLFFWGRKNFTSSVLIYILRLTWAAKREGGTTGGDVSLFFLSSPLIVSSDLNWTWSGFIASLQWHQYWYNCFYITVVIRNNTLS